jgi:GNAT superfamily N-acetyltransferase
MSGPVAIRSLAAPDAEACDAVIRSLPYHFGDEGGQAECAEAVRSQDGLVIERDGAVAGFVTWLPRFASSWEITWLAVASDARRTGLGGRLMNRVATLATEFGMQYLLVTTLSAASPEPGVSDGYDGTRRFYRSHGFIDLWEPHGWWNDENQALLLLRDLTR